MRKLFSQEKTFKLHFDVQRYVLRDKIFNYRGTLKNVLLSGQMDKWIDKVDGWMYNRYTVEMDEWVD